MTDNTGFYIIAILETLNSLMNKVTNFFCCHKQCKKTPVRLTGVFDSIKKGLSFKLSGQQLV